MIAAGFEGAPAEDRELLALVNAGVAQFHGGAHPSAEAMLRRWAGREVGGAFGPTYDRRLCAFGLNWGLFAHLALLREVDRLRPQNRAWVRDQDELASGYETWRLAYDREFTGDPSGEAGGS